MLEKMKFQMKHLKFQFATLLKGISLCFCLSGLVYAQNSYPSKPIKLVVGFAAGGPSDIVARIIGSSISSQLGQPVIVENRVGASGNIGTEAVARAAPDGYTLQLTTITHPSNENIFKNFKYKSVDYFEPIALLVDTGLVLLVHPSLNVKSVSDLVEMAKARPKEIFYATAGVGTATHLATELFNKMAAIEMTPVHYKGGGETIRDILSGNVKVMLSTIPPVINHIKDGKLRGIAVSRGKSDPNFPELSTISDSGLPGYEVSLWFGLSAPKGTPRPLISRLADAANKALESPEVQKSLKGLGYTTQFMGPVQFTEFYNNEVLKWAKVVDAIGNLEK